MALVLESVFSHAGIISTAQLSVSKAEFSLPWRVGKHTFCISVSSRQIDLCLTKERERE